jgi:hypothetical protein
MAEPAALDGARGGDVIDDEARDEREPGRATLRFARLPPCRLLPCRRPQTFTAAAGVGGRDLGAVVLER